MKYMRFYYHFEWFCPDFEGFSNNFGGFSMWCILLQGGACCTRRKDGPKVLAWRNSPWKSQITDNGLPENRHGTRVLLPPLVPHRYSQLKDVNSLWVCHNRTPFRITQSAWYFLDCCCVPNWLAWTPVCLSVPCISGSGYVYPLFYYLSRYRI